MYQALYREYRPKTFDDVLGQDHIISTIKNQISTGSLGHAYLFSGTRGTGKTSTAKIFSRAVNCLEPVDSSPCNKCQICQGLLDGSIMDVIEMDAASNRGVNDIRELRDKVAYPPSYAKYKVYIIDEVHMLTQEAFNALLKTLEEPPKHLIFILATTEPEKIPQTILSRCQRFDFKRIGTDLIMENMRNICRSLDLDIEEDALNIIARNADGGMRDALSLLDQCISFSQGPISYQDAISILGIVNIDQVFDLVDHIIQASMEEILLALDAMMEDGRDVHQFIKDIIGHFRDLMIVKTFGDASQLVEVDSQTLDRYRQQAQELRLDYIIKILDILTGIDEKARFSTEPRVLLEMAMLKIIRAENLSLEERLDRLEQAGPLGPRPKLPRPEPRMPEARRPEPGQEEVLEKPARPQPKKEPEAKAELPVREIDPESDQELLELRKNWPAIISKVKSLQVSTSVLLQKSQVTGLKGSVINLDYPSEYATMKDLISKSSNKELVENVLSDFLARKVELKFGILEEIIQEAEPDPMDLEDRVKSFFGEDKVEIKE